MSAEPGEGDLGSLQARASQRARPQQALPVRSRGNSKLILYQDINKGFFILKLKCETRLAVSPSAQWQRQNHILLTAPQIYWARNQGWIPAICILKMIPISCIEKLMNYEPE